MSTLSDIAKKVVEAGGIAVIDPFRSIKGKYKTIDENGNFIQLQTDDLISSLIDVTISDATQTTITSSLTNLNNYTVKNETLKISFNKPKIRLFLQSLNIEVNNTVVNSFIVELKTQISTKLFDISFNPSATHYVVPKVFEEYSIDYKTPFSLQEQQNYNFGLADYYDIKPNYNFYEPQYEDSIKTLNEKIIPNLYYSQQGTGSFGEKHTLLQITGFDGNVNLVKSSDYQNGFYFDEWANKIDSLLSAPRQQDYNKLSIPSTYIAINKDFSIFSDIDSQRENFPMYNKIEFTTDTGELGINSLLHDSSINCSFINTSLKEGLLTTLGASQLNSEAVLARNIVQNSSVSYTETGSPTITYNYSTSSFIGLEFQFENMISSSIFDGSIPKISNIPILSYLDDCEDLNTSSYSKSLLNLLVKLKLKSIADSNVRTYKEIYDGKLSKNETLLYIVKKISNSNQIQSFIFLNPLEAKNFVYYDTQIKYGTKYKYEVNAYQISIGTQYTFGIYSETSVGFDTVCYSVPTIKFIQTKYFEKEIINVDTPPIPLDVNFIPYFGINNKLSFYMNNQVGMQYAEPVIILDEDITLFNTVRENQGIERGPILFESESPASMFQILRLEHKPYSYSDFKDGLIINIDALEGSFSNTYLDTLEPNKNYYYTFRTLDVHNNISNPTSVFEIMLRDDGGAVYPIIQALTEFETIKEKDESKTLKRYLQILPSITQTTIETNGETESANNLPEFKLGFANDQVWDKTFKLRLRSKSTGKILDFNVSFTNKQIRE